jgi:hypothetical protein
MTVLDVDTRVERIMSMVDRAPQDDRLRVLSQVLALATVERDNEIRRRRRTGEKIADVVADAGVCRTRVYQILAEPDWL